MEFLDVLANWPTLGLSLKDHLQYAELQCFLSHTTMVLGTAYTIWRIGLTRSL